jgi:hypothetical protein
VLCSQKKNRKKQHETALPTVPSRTGAPAIDKLHQTLLTSRTGGCPKFLSQDIRQFKILFPDHSVLSIISETKRSAMTKDKIKINNSQFLPTSNNIIKLKK